MPLMLLLALLPMLCVFKKPEPSAQFEIYSQKLQHYMARQFQIISSNELFCELKIIYCVIRSADNKTLLQTVSYLQFSVMYFDLSLNFCNFQALEARNFQDLNGGFAGRPHLHLVCIYLPKHVYDIHILYIYNHSNTQIVVIIYVYYILTVAIN